MSETEEKQDSVTLGTPAKGGAVKVYYNSSKMTDEEIKLIIKKAVGQYKYLMEINQ